MQEKIKKMKSGLSKLEKGKNAAAFSYMNIIEVWGSDILRMFREVKEYGLREQELINLSLIVIRAMSAYSKAGCI